MQSERLVCQEGADSGFISLWACQLWHYQPLSRVPAGAHESPASRRFGRLLSLRLFTDFASSQL